MIQLEIPKNKISLIRTIEGRKFKNGVWEFPDSTLEKLQKLQLIDSNIVIKEKEVRYFDTSKHLYPYQDKVVQQALNDGSYGIFADTGTGKTVIGLELSTNYKKTLIICPLSIIEKAWIDDCTTFHPKIKIVSLWACNKKKRLEKLHEESDIYVINYDGIEILYNEIIKANFDCVIVDESSKMKNMTSSITGKLLNLSNFIPHRFVLSGCPTPNHNSEIFPQMKFVNPEVLGNNYYGFLARYFKQDMENPHRWFQTQENKDDFYNRLSQKCVFIDKKDCIDLPDKIFQIRQFELHKEQKTYYNAIMDDIQNNINQWSKFEFTAKLMKLRETLSGFIINKDKTISTFANNKDKELSDVISEIGGKPIIIWCQFNYEIEMLAKKFNGVGLTSKTPNRDEIIHEFKNNNIKLLFANPKLIGHGLTLTNCNYNIYYSLSFSYEEFKQSQDRIHRIGQINKCTYIILQAKNTIDEQIYSCLDRKKNIVDELYGKLSVNREPEL